MKKLAIALMFVLPLAVAPAYSDDARLLEIAHKTAIRDTLRNDLVQIQRERDRCERQRRNWTAATIAGGVGVVATGGYAIYQGGQLRNQRREIETLTTERNQLQGPQSR